MTEELPYQALLLVSFGGPERPEDVVPFLENVLRGRHVPRERVLEVAEHYQHFGGKSPLNDQNRALIAALEQELERRGPRMPIYFGNRNWTPYLAQALEQMRSDGVHRALAFFTSAYSSYSGCRQYLEDLERATAELGAGAPRVDRLRNFYNHPGFIEPIAQSLQQALERIPQARRARAQVLFTAHSVPLAQADSSDYVRQLQETARLVAESCSLASGWELVYQSRSGPPMQPWLEPDVGDFIRQHQGRFEDLLLVPIGFLCDHMEVLFDLDTECAELCAELGISLQRVPTVGTHPAFVSMIRELIWERIGWQSDRRALGRYGPGHDVCPPGCCLAAGE